MQINLLSRNAINATLICYVGYYLSNGLLNVTLISEIQQMYMCARIIIFFIIFNFPMASIKLYMPVKIITLVSQKNQNIRFFCKYIGKITFSCNSSQITRETQKFQIWVRYDYFTNGHSKGGYLVILHYKSTYNYTYIRNSPSIVSTIPDPMRRDILKLRDHNLRILRLESLLINECRINRLD